MIARSVTLSVELDDIEEDAVNEVLVAQEEAYACILSVRARAATSPKSLPESR